MFLTSPRGTVSEILAQRPRDLSDEGIDFTFMTVHNWGEDPHGEWIFTIFDRSEPSDPDNDIELESWQLILWGTEDKPQDSAPDSKSTGHASTAYNPDQKEVKVIMTEESQEADDVNIKKDSSSSSSTGSSKHSSDKHDFGNSLTSADIDEITDIFSKRKAYNADSYYYKRSRKGNFYEDRYNKRQPSLRSYNEQIRELIKAISDILDEEEER